MRGSGARRRAATGFALGLLVVILLLPSAPLREGPRNLDPTRANSLGPSTAGSGGPGRVSAIAAPLPVRADRPAASGIDPLGGYSKEPAPMGIADFGVTGPSLAPYEYTTSAFEASAQIRSMSVVVSGGGSPEEVTAFELNAMVVFQDGNSSYTYWIQNGLHVNASSREFTIGGAYVWNFSSAGAHLTAGELHGATGSVLASDTYYYIPSCNSLPGQCTTLSWPDTIIGRINASLSGGIPLVSYQYDLGSGWVTYDQVTFPHLAGATITGFTVDGFHATPYASTLFYDAEWDWVAAGGGLSMVDHGSDLTLGLEYWDGRNYQAVPCAWDFGGDTGETSQNVSVALASPGASGALGAEVSSGSGSLGILYNGSDRGFLNVSTPTTGNGTLMVGGHAVDFVGGGANLTLAPGSYPVALQGYSNASELVTVVAGQTTRIVFSGAGSTKFLEAGLPAATRWGVTINGTVVSGTGPILIADLANGSYDIDILPVPGFVADTVIPQGLLIVPSTTSIALKFSPFTFDVPFREAGLPPGTLWWVNASGTFVNGTGVTLTLSAPNGTTNYTVGSGYAFVATPSAGSVRVLGGAFSAVVVQFTYRLAYIVGSVSPVSATVTLDNTTVTLTNGQFNASVRPGVYELNATAPGYLARSIEVTATPGNGTVEDVTLVPSNPDHGANSTSSGGSSATLEYVGIGVIVVAIAAAAGVLWFRRGKARG